MHLAGLCGQLAIRLEIFGLLSEQLCVPMNDRWIGPNDDNWKVSPDVVENSMNLDLPEYISHTRYSTLFRGPPQVS